MSKIHNLDEGVRETFDFVVKGFTYRFRQLNTEEMQEFRSLAKKLSKLSLLSENEEIEKEEEKAEEELNEFLYKFISSVSDKAPAFKEIQKKMLQPQWTKFQDMIEAEFKG
jgi:hypothetical protein